MSHVAFLVPSCFAGEPERLAAPRVYCDCAELAHTPKRYHATQTMLMDMYLRLRWYFLDLYYVHLHLATA